MKVLFLPNFSVRNLSADDPSIAPPNKVIDARRYWFFRHLDGWEVTVIDNRAPLPFRLIRRLAKIEIFQTLKAIVRQRDFDVIISHSFSSGFVFALLRSVFSKNGKIHIVIDVGSLNGGKENRLQLILIRLALRSVSGLIYHSTVNEGFYQKHFPAMRRAFVPFGADTDMFKPSAEEPKGNHALSIGDSFRDYDDLLRAWSKIDIPLKIVGITAIDRRGLPNVELIPKTTVDKLIGHIKDAKIIILPIRNLRYSIGQMTLTQCMAMQKPIVVSRSYGVSNYCEDGVNCLTYECGNESEIAEKVNSLISNPDLARKIAQQGRSDVLSRFNEKAMAIGIREFVEQFLSSKGQLRN
jgi:glycosyltransferase involved in cell wall biosynthesis